MKNMFLIACLVFSTTLFAQEWGSVNKNNVILKEIAPIWPGCEGGSVEKRDACFNDKLTQHILKNFKYPAEAYKKNEQGKVEVDFIINEKGLPEIKGIKGGGPLLQEEAKRIIMTIPKMSKPGMLGGKPRAIEMTVPFTFKTGK